MLRFSFHGLQGHAEPAEDRLSHEGQPLPAGAGDAGPLGQGRHLRAHPAGVGRPAALDPARRSALRQRPHPHGPRAEQGAEGLRREVPGHARPRLGVRPGLGLPRPAHRAPGRQGAGPRSRLRRRAARHGSDREAPPLPRVRRALHRHPARGVPAARHLRRLGQPVPDHGSRLPGHHRARVRAVRRPRDRLQGPQARSLVHALQDGPGPSRGRVRGRDGAVRLRDISREDELARPGRGRRWPPRAAGHLDHDAVDASRQSRHRRAPGAAIPGARGRRRAAHGRAILWPRGSRRCRA